MKCCGRAADPTAKLFQACKGQSNSGPVRRGGGGSVREWRLKTGPPAAFHRVQGNSMEGVKARTK